MNALIKLRERLKLTQKEIGEKLGVTQSAICQLETGKRKVRPEFAKQVIEFGKQHRVKIRFEDFW